MKLLIVAGGGGHFTPALALIEKLPKEWEILVVGRKYSLEGDSALSLEYQTAKRLNLPFKTITTGRLQRRLTSHTFSSLAKIPVGFFQSLQLVRNFKPDVLISFGGYLSVPVVLASRSFGVPIVIHEQTLGAGLANKISAHVADKVCISWKSSERFFPREKIVLTGNPLKTKQNESTVDLPSGREPLIYITGGSAGSHAINRLIEGCLEKLLQHYRVVHQTGDAKEFADYDRLQTVQKSLPIELQKHYVITKFFAPTEALTVLQKADLVIARSGMGTLTELLSLGKPALFIPLPYGQHNEQLTNALFAQKVGIAEVVQQDSLTSGLLYATIEKMLQRLSEYTKHSADAKLLIKPDAAEHIIEVINDVSKQQNNPKK